jgi:hypothetical protein
MPVLDRSSSFSLWMSDNLPDDTAKWHKLDAGPDRNGLERQAKSMARLLTMRRLVVIEGQEPPRWKPKL